jgi:hypothetical protein
MDATAILTVLFGAVGMRVYSRLTSKKDLTPEQEFVAFAKITFGIAVFVFTGGGGVFEIRDNQEVCVETKKN